MRCVNNSHLSAGSRSVSPFVQRDLEDNILLRHTLYTGLLGDDESDERDQVIVPKYLLICKQL